MCQMIIGPLKQSIMLRGSDERNSFKIMLWLSCDVE